MSKLSKLIEELCPEGVEYKRIDTLFETFSGMTGVSDKWKESGNCQFIDYLNVYNNMRVDVKNLPFATVKSNQQNILKKGDILLTCASETPDECAMSSVIRDDIKDGIFLDDHLFAIRLKDEYCGAVDTAFLNYYMHTSAFRVQVCKKVRGVTRFYITGKPFMSLEIPVPPLPVQEEIVRILDKFTTLEAELEAELEARRKQYEYYRNELLTFNKVGGVRFDVKWVTLGEIAEIGTGSSNTNEELEEGKYPFFVRSQVVRYKNEYEYDETAIITSGDGVGVGKVFHYIEGKYALHQRAYRIKINDGNLNSKFFYYYMRTTFYNYIMKNAYSSSVTSVRRPMLIKFPVPLPPLPVQRRIVSILDRFEALTTDLQSGLPAEIKARRKQYEYYREKLLTFKLKTTLL